MGKPRHLDRDRLPTLHRKSITAGRMSVQRARGILFWRLGVSPSLRVIIVAVGIAGCSTSPPPFTIEPACSSSVPGKAVRSRRFETAAAPPPGISRIARIDETGNVELTETVSVNGPGPWLSYVGRSCIAPSRAKGVLDIKGDPSPA